MELFADLKRIVEQHLQTLGVEFSATGLPRAYTPDLYQGKCSALFEHVFESYYGEGMSIYAGAA